MDKSVLPAEKCVTARTIDSAVNTVDTSTKDSASVNAPKKGTSNPPEEAIDCVPCNTKGHTTRNKETNEKRSDGKVLPELGTITEELLGSVTTYNCHGTRTSARVIQKMRQDQQTRPITPPLNERETGRKDERSGTQKTPSQVRANRPTWSNNERNHFFDALNEFGKDFDAIGNFINAKLKRRSPAIDVSFKSKDQVRQHYYQTYHKICKYVRFSEELRKPVQEIYALVNYGEMRRKLQFVTDKHFMKLRKLIYHGHVTVRCKGKNIRIKTPSCKALRRLNQLDDSLEDIKLPSKIEVIVSPSNMEAFGRVQTIAQSPRCRAIVPLHKKLINFINTFQYKWRSMDVRLSEEAKHINANEIQSQNTSVDPNQQVQDTEICFLPKPGVVIHRPLLSITEYLSSVNICLTAYEERMGIQTKADSLNVERSSAASSSTCQFSCGITPATKRSRTDSSSEKKMPPEHLKRLKSLDVSSENPLTMEENIKISSSSNDLEILSSTRGDSGDELSDEIQELLSDSIDLNKSKEEVMFKEKNLLQSNITPTQPNDIISTNTPQLPTVRSKPSRSLHTKSARSVFKPLLKSETVQRIRSGWTASSAGDLTIGDLYVVIGHDSKLELDYYWLPPRNSISATTASTSTFQTTDDSICQALEGSERQPSETVVISNKLKQLLLIANLSEQMRRRPCNCDRNFTIKSRHDRDFLASRSFVSNRTYGIEPSAPVSSGGLFRQPLIPARRTTIDPVKQLTTLTRQKMSRQILVQRLLLPNNGNMSNLNRTPGNISSAIMPSDYTLKNTSNMSWNETKSKESNASDRTATSSDTTGSQELSVFLNSLNSEETTPYSEESSTSPRAKPSRIIDHLNDLCDQGSTSANTIDRALDDSSNTTLLSSMSPMHLLRESTSNSRWIEDNINDFSLTSLLGHLDEINSSRDLLDHSSNISIISESSVDYMHKFQEITALLQSQEKD